MVHKWKTNIFIPNTTEVLSQMFLWQKPQDVNKNIRNKLFYLFTEKSM